MRYVILPYTEFAAIQEELEDYYDLKALREAQKEEANAPTISLEEARLALGLS
jgi:hypothetical protein